MQIDTCLEVLVALSASMVATDAVCVVHHPSSQVLPASRHIAEALVSPSSSVPSGQSPLPRDFGKAIGEGSKIVLLFTHVVLETRSEGGVQWSPVKGRSFVYGVSLWLGKGAVGGDAPVVGPTTLLLSIHRTVRFPPWYPGIA